MEKLVDYKKIEHEIVRTLKDLIKIDTRNVIGNNIKAIQYVSKKLNTFGIKNHVYEPYPGKANLVGIIEGTSDESIILYSHIDIDDFNENDWKYHPLSGTEIDNKIYGRGALDCKGLLSVWINIMKKIAIGNKKPEKTVLMVVACDEEIQGDMGLKWLLDNTSYFENSKLVISEGGGYPLKFKNKTYYTCQTGERIKSSIKNRKKLKKGILLEYRNLILGYLNNYYNFNTILYAIKSKNCKQNIRRISWETFTSNIITESDDKDSYELPFLKNSAIQPNKTKNTTKYIGVFKNELIKLNRNYKLLNYISPGLSDNKRFSDAGIVTIGFFPLDIENKITGIHGKNEYISRNSICKAYNILLDIINKIIFEEEF